MLRNSFPDKSAWLLGMSFVVEGARPFISIDSKRVRTALMVGSAIAGGMSMALQVTLPIPHGGLLVLPFVNHPLFFLMAIMGGTFVAALWINRIVKLRSA
jgi:PTS system fructose-specific IIC component